MGFEMIRDIIRDGGDAFRSLQQVSKFPGFLRDKSFFLFAQVVLLCQLLKFLINRLRKIALM